MLTILNLTILIYTIMHVQGVPCVLSSVTGFYIYIYKYKYIYIGGWYWKMCQYAQYSHCIYASVKIMCQCRKNIHIKSICSQQIRKLKECRLSHWVLPRSSALIELTLGCIHVYTIIYGVLFIHLQLPLKKATLCWPTITQGFMVLP